MAFLYSTLLKKNLFIQYLGLGGRSIVALNLTTSKSAPYTAYTVVVLAAGLRVVWSTYKVI